MKKHNFPLYKIFVYVALITLAISIIVPIAWVFLASLKSQLELVSGNPFDLPKQILWSNFADAFVKARMGDYLLNTIIVTKTIISHSIGGGSSCIVCFGTI